MTDQFSRALDEYSVEIIERQWVCADDWSQLDVRSAASDREDEARAAVEATYEALRADAERYRYVRVHATGPIEPWSTHSSPESFDRVVDEAIRGLK